MFIFVLHGVSGHADVSSGLLGYWKFDEGSGSVAGDSSGLGNAGLMSGTSGWTAGRFGAAVLLTNNVGSIAIGEKPMFNLSTKTVTFWVKIFTNKTLNIVYADKRGDFISFDNAGYIRAYWRNATNASMVLYYNPYNTLGVWTFYAIVYDVNSNAVNVSCYKNGVLQNTRSDTSGITPSPVLYLGSRNSAGDHSLNGALDDYRIYARVLSAADILDVYNGAQPTADLQAPSICTNLVLAKVIANEVDLAWAAAMDNVCVLGYKIYRDGSQVAISPTNAFADVGVAQNSRYTYTITAFDGMGNESGQSAPVTVNTPAKPADWPAANFSIDPGSGVEVGEAVLFDGSLSSDDQSFTNVIGAYPNEKATDFDWDFGDGYTFKRSTGEKDNGPVCLHYFMKPGVYNVVLTVTDTDGNKDSMVKQVTVSGEAPAPGFELWHAPFHARIAQYIYAQVPESLRTCRLIVTLASDAGYSGTLLDKSGLLAEERFLLDYRNLPVGNYVIQADILSGTTKVSRVREKFRKDFLGIPHVGIDENNAIRVDNKPYFPVTPWLLGKSEMKQWSRYCNTLFGQGYVNGEVNTNSWRIYLDEAKKNNMLAIGPEFWRGKGVSHFYRQSDIKGIHNYVRLSKDHASTFGYSWNDEPNLGGCGLRNPAKVLSAWNYIAGRDDSQHPMQVNLYGGDFSICNGDPNVGISPYAFLYNSRYFGGKRHCIGDIIGLDMYVLEYYDHPSMNAGILAADGLIANWVKLLENMKKWYHNLTPFTQFIESQDVANAATVLAGKNTHGPTPEQARMEFWLSITHGCHMINYFNLRLDRNPANQGVLEENLRIVTKYADVLLGPEPSTTVTDNANERGRQVDTLIRETSSDILIFAIRLTEPDSSQSVDGLSPEDESINVTFAVNGAGTGAIYDEFYPLENICEYFPVIASNNTFSFTLSRRPVSGTVAVAGVYENKKLYYGPNLSISDPAWMYACDQADGSLSGDVIGKPNSGTVNYTNGVVGVKFGKNVLVGPKYLAATYTPVRPNRTLIMNGGVFSDAFKRCGLHIYRIPKAGGIVTLPLASPSPPSNLIILPPR